MALLKLDIHAVRNIKHAVIAPSSKINFFYGGNGSGKSAVLEAIFLLGRAKSFRSTTVRSVINFAEKQLIVVGAIQRSNCYRLGIQMSDKDCVIHVNQQLTAKRSDLAYNLPLQLFHPKSYELLDAGGQVRREFLDWGVFNSKEAFLPIWKYFKKALSYRNALLKNKDYKQLDTWSKELVFYGSQVADYRTQYFTQLQPVFASISQQFLKTAHIDLKLHSGWNEAVSYEQALADDFDKDLRHGFTHSGPHRADFHVFDNGRLAKNYVSRGQLKLLVVSLLLAQVQLMIDAGEESPCVLIDDFAAELDKAHREKVLSYLASMNCQVFITAIERADFEALELACEYKMFHVEQGNVTVV